MSVFLPMVQPHHTLLTKLGIRLFNWLMWLFPALYDCTALDVGSTYQIGLSAIVAGAFSVMCTMLLFGSAFFGLTVPTLLALVCAAYLFFGLLYHLYERSWHP